MLQNIIPWECAEWIITDNGKQLEEHFDDPQTNREPKLSQNHRIKEEGIDTRH